MISFQQNRLIILVFLTICCRFFAVGFNIFHKTGYKASLLSITRNNLGHNHIIQSTSTISRLNDKTSKTENDDDDHDNNVAVENIIVQKRRSHNTQTIGYNHHDGKQQRRRDFLLSSTTAAGFVVASAVLTVAPTKSSAAIDLSGLKVEGGGNSILKDQLKQFDGSASSRINQVKELSSYPATTTPASTSGTAKEAKEIDSAIATWLYRSNSGLSPRLSRSGLLNLFRYDDTVVSADGKGGSVGISFEFPSDWLQLDKFLGGISYIDQRNGDRLYVLRTKLPEGERLATIQKSFFGTSLFDPNGTIVKSQGVDIDDYKVVSSRTLEECPNDTCSRHVRYKIKYSTITGNGLRVERRALLDAYEMTKDGDIYMIVTSSNAIKFENKDSLERKTVEAIVDSFRINV